MITAQAFMLSPDILVLLIPIVAVIGGVVIAIVSVVAGHAAKIRQAELEAALKQDMLNRGMTAEQIQQVLQAGHNRGSWQAQRARQAELDAALKQDMLNRGMSAEQIQQVLQSGKSDWR